MAYCVILAPVGEKSAFDRLFLLVLKMSIPDPISGPRNDLLLVNTVFVVL